MMNHIPYEGQTMGKAKAVKKSAKRKTPFVYASQQELQKEYTPEDHKTLISAEYTKPKECTKETFAQITPSYWRVTYWGKNDPTNIFSGDKILSSKFIRIDIDSVGRLQYNDVTEGKRL